MSWAPTTVTMLAVQSRRKCRLRSGRVSARKRLQELVDERAHLLHAAAALVEHPVALGQPGRAEPGTVLLGDVLARGVEDVALLLVEVVQQGLAELVEVLAEVLVVELGGLEQREQGLVALVVLLLAVLGLLLVDRVLALELGVDLALLGLAVRDQQLGDLLAQGVAVVLLVAQLAQQGLEEPVVVEDQLDDVALLGARDRGGVRVRHALNVSRSADLDVPITGPVRYVRPMTPEEMLEHCLAKPGAWPDNPWDHEHPVVKVHDKIFAFIGGDGVGVKSGPTREVADEWLDRYPDDASVMAYIGRSGWNDLRFGGAIDDEELREAVDESYRLVVGKLAKKHRPPGWEG